MLYLVHLCRFGGTVYTLGLFQELRHCGQSDKAA